MTQEHWQHVAVPFLEANSRLGFGTTEAGRQAHSYATALVASYSFSLGKDRVQAMVPFWDMLNHASPGGEGVRLHYDQDSKSMQMITTKPHKEGQQVLPHPPAHRHPLQSIVMAGIAIVPSQLAISHFCCRPSIFVAVLRSFGFGWKRAHRPSREVAIGLSGWPWSAT